MIKHNKLIQKICCSIAIFFILFTLIHSTSDYILNPRHHVDEVDGGFNAWVSHSWGFASGNGFSNINKTMAYQEAKNNYNTDMLRVQQLGLGCAICFILLSIAIKDNTQKSK